MQKNIINILSFLLLLFFFAILSPHRAHAVAPSLWGFVKTTTNAPVVGVWVKWVENGGDESDPANGVRYAQTDATGRFEFASWHSLLFNREPIDPLYNYQYKTFIDTDLDGINDARMNSINIPAEPWDVMPHFGCLQNDHVFTVIKPVGWTGNFNSGLQHRLSFQNIGKDKDIGTIIYDPSPILNTSCGTADLYSNWEAGDKIRVTNISTSRVCAWNGAIYASEATDSDTQYGPAVIAGRRVLNPGESYTWDPTPHYVGYQYDGKQMCFLHIYSFTSEQGYSPPTTFGAYPNFGTRLLGDMGYGWDIRNYTGLPGMCTPPPDGIYKISGTVFIDSNQNGVRDGGEIPYRGATINLSGLAVANTITDTNGYFEFLNLNNGTYTVSLNQPVGYNTTSPISQVVTIGPNNVTNFGIHKYFYIAGYVFNDISKDNFRDANEPYYKGGITITSTGGSLYLDSDTGTFDINELTAGTYTISYTSIPQNFRIVYPKNGPPPSYTVRVGPTCMVDATTGATCTVEGDIIKLGFAVSDSIPWTQPTGGGIIMDNGYVNYIPSTPTCSTPHAILGTGGNNPSVISSGDVDPYFGYGSSSSTQWITGGLAYPNLFKSNGIPLQTSYPTLLANLNKSGVTITNLQTLSGCGTLSSCSLPNSLNAANAPRVFRANGNVTLNGFSFPNNKNSIFLINGDLRIQGDLDVPTGTTVIFSTSRDIIIDRTVGEAPTCTPSNNRGIEGIFSADRDVTVEGTPNCAGGADPMLKIEGIVIVNALRNGGAFTNNRDLCANNRNYPSVQFISRPDFILNAPDVLKGNHSSIKN